VVADIEDEIGTGVLLVEHHADLIFDICHHVTVLNLGKMLAADWFSLFEATRGFMTAMGMVTPEGFDQVSATARAELASPHGQCFMPVYIAYGQRPG